MTAPRDSSEMPTDDEAPFDTVPARSSEEDMPTRAHSPASDNTGGSLSQQDETGESSDRPAFSSDDILAERYRIIRFVARGGMGEVYEAEDLTLRGRLALKTIRPEIARNPTSVERFKREINLARRVTHPNISRIYDVGLHRGPSETMFLTMEFLSGDTLAGLLARNGRMTEGVALPLIEQIAAGLAAAHEAGIIHRDFKSANVMLVPGLAGQGFRAVITDFGLARVTENEEGVHSLTEAGAFMGTPAYMAPEQVEGLLLTPAADIYALGIVLYEMVTGRRPFEGDSPVALAIKRLTDSPVPPRQVLSSLDPAWDSAILRCLARNPADRFQSAPDVAHALRTGAMQPAIQSAETQKVILLGETGVAPARRKMRGIGLIVAASLTAAALAIFGGLTWRSSRSQATAPAIASGPRSSVSLRRAVAVLGLRNNSGRADAAWLATAISEMLTTELAAGGKLRVTPAQDVARLRSDLGLGEADSLTAVSLERVRNNLGVHSLVLGSYTLVGEPGSRLLRIDLRLLDATTGRTVASSEANGTELQLFDLVSRAGGRLRQKLGLGELSPAESVEFQASIPSNREAVRLYAEGIARLQLLDAAGARDLLTKAVAADNKHPLIHSELSAAYAALGDEPKARELAARAVALSGSLAREQKLQIEARLHEAAKDWGKAVDVETSLWESFPDNIDYGLNLANSQISGAKTREALVTIEALRKIPPPVSADGRIDLVESRAYQEMGDFARQKRLAGAAVSKGRATGSRLLVARARMLEATALLALGDMSGTSAAVDEARSIFQSAGDRGGVARALELTADMVNRQGDLEGELKLLEKALATHRQVGDRSSAARVLSNIGKVLYLKGRTSEAEKFFDESLATFRQFGAKFPAAMTLNNLGAMMFNRGDLPAAQKRYSEALTLFGELGDRYGTAMTLTNIAEVLECRGDLKEARSMHESSLAINREIGEKTGAAYDLFRLGEIFALRGELVAARDRYQQAITIQDQIGDKLGAADSRVAMASLSIEQGKAVEAEKIAREAEEILRTEGREERAFLALAVISDSLRSQGKRKEALETAQQAWKMAVNSDDRRVRFRVAVSMARAMAASRKPDDVEAALTLLEVTRAEASRSHFVVSELESRLASGEIETAAGRMAGKKHLQSLGQDAKQRGFGRIASRASAGSG